MPQTERPLLVHNDGPARLVWVHRDVGERRDHEMTPFCFCHPIGVSEFEMNDPRRDRLAEIHAAVRSH